MKVCEPLVTKSVTFRFDGEEFAGTTSFGDRMMVRVVEVVERTSQYSSSLDVKAYGFLAHHGEPIDWHGPIRQGTVLIADSFRQKALDIWASL